MMGEVYCRKLRYAGQDPNCAKSDDEASWVDPRPCLLSQSMSAMVVNGGWRLLMLSSSRLKMAMEREMIAGMRVKMFGHVDGDKSRKGRCHKGGRQRGR